MRCKKENDGTLKDKEKQEMKNLNDKNTRQKLVVRYQNAETTLEEERLLAEFLTDTDDLLSTEEEDVRLLLQMSDCMEQPAISEEKADEFDRLMQKDRHKSSIVYMRWIVSSAAAAVIIAFVFMTNRQNIDIPEDMHINEMTQAVNFQNEQVEFYQLRPAGDATIVTMTYSDGGSSSYVICASDDGSSYQIVPMIEM